MRGRSLPDREGASGRRPDVRRGRERDPLRGTAADRGHHEGACGCHLEPALSVSQGAVSQALSRLYAAGPVSRRKEGRWRYYSAMPRAERLLAVLDETRDLDDG